MDEGTPARRSFFGRLALGLLIVAIVVLLLGSWQIALFMLLQSLGAFFLSRFGN